MPVLVYVANMLVYIDLMSTNSKVMPIMKVLWWGHAVFFVKFDDPSSFSYETPTDKGERLEMSFLPQTNVHNYIVIVWLMFHFSCQFEMLDKNINMITVYIQAQFVSGICGELPVFMTINYISFIENTELLTFGVQNQVL